ncbi:hypothetical protein [Lentimicrobium sp.]|jgi:hypothetical protein|uniref:hypothetical protein n=1 Tax=Lentimicrobium sp. TaxID=2034841 RepID=UPI002C9403A7|nr:hypothetical protein [Lentimicrobium sp.]HOP13178.1 hypothetical protein [Lentimicrobium sp.]HPF63644.1 hypothetical protein [Lentimicrobium sp.]
MIEDLVKIHDKFSVEIKLGFYARRKQPVSDFAVNTWIFIPNSLDINRGTYQKADFYRDLKSNIRLITPSYLLRDIADKEKPPFSLLENALQQLASDPSRTRTAEYEYHIRMFVSIVKSSLREEIQHILENGLDEDLDYLVDNFDNCINNIAANFRSLKRIINVPSISRELMNYYFFGDEFLSNLFEQHAFKLIDGLKKKGHLTGDIREKIMALIHAEINYKKEKGYQVVEKESPNRNRNLVFRLSLLKKYAENELFLNTNQRRDGVWIEQVYLSIAAGLSMVFATAVAFSFQQKYGNFTMPFFVALVVSYMLKDRIKELTRYYFAHKLGRRFFDHRTDISLSEHEIGWSKESMVFVPESKVPGEVLKIRDRSAILEADNRNNREKIILYRKLIRLNRQSLDECSLYPTSGMNDIIRFNVSNFIHKMDNPIVPLYSPGNNDEIETVKGEKMYYINLVLQFKNEDQLDYKRYRIVLNRKGINEIEKF